VGALGTWWSEMAERRIKRTVWAWLLPIIRGQGC
jgi:hypothetical protein